MPAADQGLRPDDFSLVPRVLVFITHAQSVLLIKGAPDKRIWAGKYNGVGGHVERGEDIWTAAVREVREETGLEVHGLQLRGIMTVDTGAAAGAATGIALFVFTAAAAGLAVVPGPEGTLEWIPLDRLPELDLVEDLPILLPRVLALGPNAPLLFGRYHYDAGGRLQVDFPNQ